MYCSRGRKLARAVWVCTVWAALALISACSSPPPEQSGTIRIALHVYNDPVDRPDELLFLPVSELYYSGDRLIESLFPLQPSMDFRHPPPGSYFLLDLQRQYYRQLGSLPVGRLLRRGPLAQKAEGLDFRPRDIEAYRRRIPLPDTLLDNRLHRRVRIATRAFYAVYYLWQTRQRLPYSFNRQIEADYGGILDRIDTYEIRENRFTSMRLSVVDSLPLPARRAFAQWK